ncbi:MAG: alkaline phosphatase family protein [Thiocapsa sp.]|nr:alkaline phosphatase family protein [Thiocapsa sp.]MCG6896310.1 alkaline phosphatase family protein [Thiocapsa sp.]
MKQNPTRLALTALVACMAVVTGRPASSQTSGDTLDAAGATPPPRLILQITVDALRGDLPGRYAHVFGDGGFRYLMGEDVQYTNAHYQHANTETIVGHVSLATGTVPAAHGMVGNV